MTTVADDLGVESRAYSYPIDISVENWAAGTCHQCLFGREFPKPQEFVL